ncbi:hypothetical protein B0A50_03469 [Salinomyces thailandicus]|uniref:Conserved oligomeric Golgi complex subunit 2 n=1 Tax=Salinomyces thailandicus TaxID=706561 RepID=A0A4U0U4V7_9PEZI|nr:hypothetical protein B0A50_03469 [Salinomyces thailandica]
MSQFSRPSTNTASTPARANSPDQDDFDDLDTLPYPTELPRNDFLALDFNPQTYLSSLRNRHQTLEDLRSDLRQRSQLLNRELLDLVNGNYEDFLSLGGDLKGGEEKVESVRVGLLAFQREVEGVRRAVREREDEAEALLAEKKGLRGSVVLGRALLEIHESLRELEEGLGIVETENDDDGEDLDDDDEDDISPDDVRLRRLARHVKQYSLLFRQMERLSGHPFLDSQRPRLVEVRKTLLLDLAAALRQARTGKQPDGILKVVKMYGELDAEGEAIRVLKAG